MSKSETIQISEEEDCLIVNGQKIYISSELRKHILDEYDSNPDNCAISQFVAGKKLTGLVCSIGLPDFHIGYALPIGSIAVIDLSNPDAAISPDGVGFDINCGVRCLKTNLFLKDFIPSSETSSSVNDKRELIGNLLVEQLPFEDIPVEKRISPEHLNGILDEGMEYLLKIGRVCKEDLDFTESRGSLEGNSRIINQKAKSRGSSHLGTLGSGNHYLEIEVVDQICDEAIAKKLGIEEGQIVISIHTGSRGLGHGCCSDILEEMKQSNIDTTQLIKDRTKEEFKKISENDSLSKEEKKVEYEKITQKFRQEKKEAMTKKEIETLEFVPFRSEIGQKYLKTMNSASNFAWANRSVITEKVRKVFSQVFPEVEIKLIYDVCHNVAKIEKIDGREYLILRKGASRILPPGHLDLPEEYKDIGQPVLVGGSMGTCSYLIVGDKNAKLTYYSTCHGAGRLVSRSKSKQKFSVEEVIEDMKSKDVVFKVGSIEGMVEECANCYKDVEVVVNHSQKIGVSKNVCRVKPILVLKG
ncbi:uncharacterized protein VICG_00334 [Vittaforma corneae ATCC 50505]|uniref:3'-phosphate/5'-hydroxy nucleic acid ligase n=1 Tax=Vittaforma corneae (strain ATCC 50505) TaxID=993615 RepID=L2GQI7_VITCO|nr:uncharacterized protein VICG_00334 [Vittaforma corneae ATCC 50505]ELA42582.1 hypothetical protein VICG_00334 [Vittaforma corneae ATCC 50505]